MKTREQEQRSAGQALGIVRKGTVNCEDIHREVLGQAMKVRKQAKESSDTRKS
jgi:hypothetical protein